MSVIVLFEPSRKGLRKVSRAIDPKLFLKHEKQLIMGHVALFYKHFSFFNSYLRTTER